MAASLTAATLGRRRRCGVRALPESGRNDRARRASAPSSRGFGPTRRLGAPGLGHSATRRAPPDAATVPSPSLHLLAGAGLAPCRAAGELGRRGDPGTGRVRSTVDARLAVRVVCAGSPGSARGRRGADEGFFLYSEETDLFRRLRGRGWRAHFEPKAVAYHQGYGSAPWETVSPISPTAVSATRASITADDRASGGDRRDNRRPWPCRRLGPPPGRRRAGIWRLPALR